MIAPHVYPKARFHPISDFPRDFASLHAPAFDHRDAQRAISNLKELVEAAKKDRARRMRTTAGASRS